MPSNGCFPTPHVPLARDFGNVVRLGSLSFLDNLKLDLPALMKRRAVVPAEVLGKVNPDILPSIFRSDIAVAESGVEPLHRTTHAFAHRFLLVGRSCGWIQMPATPMVVAKLAVGSSGDAEIRTHNKNTCFSIRCHLGKNSKGEHHTSTSLILGFETYLYGNGTFTEIPLRTNRHVFILNLAVEHKASVGEGKNHLFANRLLPKGVFVNE